MTLKYTEIVSSTQRRAQKVSSARGLYILNELIRIDIYAAVTRTFPDYFQDDTELTMVSGTTSYALPADFYASREVIDESGNVILRGKNTPLDVDPKNKVQIYGGNLVVNADRSFTTLYVKYNKPIPDFDATNDIGLPDDIVSALKNIWVTGLEYFYFSENKKTQETQTSFTRYEDAKLAIFTYSVGTLV